MDSLPVAILRFGMIAKEAEYMFQATLEHAAKEFLDHAKNAIGTYEYGWTPLKEKTVQRKSTGDSPLLETGEMRDSGYYEVKGGHAIIGFHDHKLVYHEFGTRNIPPRPVIGGTIQHHGKEIATGMGMRFGMMLGAALNMGSITGAVNRIMGHK
jgi:hypothetical protein